MRTNPPVYSFAKPRCDWFRVHGYTRFVRVHPALAPVGKMVGFPYLTSLKLSTCSRHLKQSRHTVNIGSNLNMLTTSQVTSTCSRHLT